jgi:hypothetical protein
LTCLLDGQSLFDSKQGQRLFLLCRRIQTGSEIHSASFPVHTRGFSESSTSVCLDISPIHSDCPWGPPSFLLCGHRSCFPGGERGRSVILITFIRLASSLRMSGAVPYVPHMPSCRGQRQLCPLYSCYRASEQISF